MKMFLGEYNPNITEGSRIALPKKIREQVSGDVVIMSKGFEKCIHIYDREDWTVQAQKQIENLKNTSKVSDLERYLFASAVEVAIDAQGRVVVPQQLLDYAGAKKNLAVVGVGDRVEVWDKETWSAYYEKISAKLSE